MKIGRNDPCPCGSGKKYKKCCLGQSVLNHMHASNGPSAQGSYFEYILPIADDVAQILSQYVYEDIITAVFCINSWRANRSAVAQSLTLNAAIKKSHSHGSKHIESYEQLAIFYEEIKPYVGITPMEDYAVDDYGEVFLPFDGKHYPIITGTGHQQVYGALRFLSTLASLSHNERQLISLLEYVELFIEATKNSNIPNTEMRIVFELPSNDYWADIKKLFTRKDFCSLMEKAYSCMDSSCHEIERQHFVSFGDSVYPLFNTSLLLDYYDTLLKNATPEMIEKHIVITLCSVIDNSYNSEESPYPVVFIKPCIISIHDQKTISRNDILFVAHNQKHLLIAIQAKEDNGANKAIISRIEEIKETNNFAFVESINRGNPNGNCAITIDSQLELFYVLVYPFTNPTQKYSILGTEDDPFSCSALDLLYMSAFSDDIAELIRFIEYENSEDAQILSIGGMSNLFFTWKESNHYVSSGAIVYDLIQMDYNMCETYVLDFFSKTLKNYPRNSSHLFFDPFTWKVEDGRNGYSTLIHKGHRGFGGSVKQLKTNTYLFLAHNVQFYTLQDFQRDGNTLLLTVDELNEKLFDRYTEQVAELSVIDGKTLELLYMPMDYAMENHYYHHILHAEEKLVCSEALVEDDQVTIRYSVNQILLAKIEEANDRTIENEFFLEVLAPLKEYSTQEYLELSRFVTMDNHKLKTVGTFSIALDYYYSQLASDIHISAESYSRVRKEIAQICFSSDIQPGEYHGKDATQIIRKMQLAIVSHFEQYIANLEKDDLHNLSLGYLSVQEYGVDINLRRYRAFKNLDSNIQAEFDQETRSLRENYKRNAATAEYLIESNLAIDHNPSNKACSPEDFEYLLAFANWLIVLQDNADLCFHNKEDVYFVIDEQYLVDAYPVNEDQPQTDMYIQRKYDNIDYQLKADDVDKDFILKARDAFEEDTNIDLALFYDFIEYVQLSLPQNGLSKEVNPNVFEIDKNQLIECYQAEISSNTPSVEAILRVIQFLTLDPTKIKMVNGKPCDVLPIWEREKRNHRFRVKPFIERDGKCVFSPITMKVLLSAWKDGILSWYLPFEVGMGHLKETITTWKKHYEDAMVQDIAAAFRAAGFDISIPEVDLAKHFRRTGYPKDLGDYDVIAIHKRRKELWIIESKVLQKVGSIYEDQMQQKGFFRQHKDDEKFQRRIDFMTKNLSSVLSSFGILEKGYTIVPYMVTNKLFASRYKKIRFPIITYHELMAVIECTSADTQAAE